MASTARYATENGSKYLQQLCNHFAHKVAVSFDESQGTAALMTGPATFVADTDGLTIRVTADDMKGLIQARFAIDVHLVTFAHREGFSGLSWNVEDLPEASAPA
ncbi:DUF2218 domain-containing protein [Pseudotabrizicola sp. 4114]|uniref:DUF2218 domain-containing protein n=1 Tax=Pseudotabrizicola sp. 4114 TaxID=2817731 RepID=UPI0032B7A215